MAREDRRRMKGDGRLYRLDEIRELVRQWYHRDGEEYLNVRRIIERMKLEKLAYVFEECQRQYDDRGRIQY